MACQPDFQASNVILLRGAAWLDAWVHEVTVFPNGAKDDRVDACSQLLNYCKGSDDLASFLKWAR